MLRRTLTFGAFLWALSLGVACTQGPAASNVDVESAQIFASDDAAAKKSAAPPKNPKQKEPAILSAGGLPFVGVDADGLNRGDMASEVEGQIVYGGEGSLALSSFIGTKPSDKKAGVIVAFGASWCGYCKKSIPTLKQLQKDNPSLQIVYVGTDTDEAGWKKEIAFFERENVNFPLIRTSNPRSIMRVYFGAKNNIPRFYLVDHTGIIRVKDQGFSEKKMGQLLPKQVRWLLAQAPA